MPKYQMVIYIYLQPLNLGEAGKVQQTDQLKAMSEEVYNMIVNNMGYDLIFLYVGRNSSFIV